MMIILARNSANLTLLTEDEDLLSYLVDVLEKLLFIVYRHAASRGFEI